MSLVILDWPSEWITTPGRHKIRYRCPEHDCGEYFDVTPGTPYRLRDELVLRHASGHLVNQAERYLKRIRERHEH